MSQRAVERVLGRMIRDAGFRAEFFENPEHAAARLGVDLTPAEERALLRTDEARLEIAAASLAAGLRKSGVASVEGR